MNATYNAASNVTLNAASNTKPNATCSATFMLHQALHPMLHPMITQFGTVTFCKLCEAFSQLCANFNTNRLTKLCVNFVPELRSAFLQTFC
jgi:hypothetical protein